jgi:thiamine-phosphate pyrophosphorylase
VTAAVQLPAFAIGGVDLSNIDQVLAAGCRRIAVSSAIHQADSAVAATRELAERLKSLPNT